MVKLKKSHKQKKSEQKTKKIKKPVLHSETKKGILAVVSFTLAVLSFLSFFNQAGLFGQYFYKTSRLLFGQGFFFISISFILAGLAILLPRFKTNSRVRPVYRTIFIGGLLFIFSVLGIFHILGVGVGGQDMSLSELKIKTGGYFGLMIGYPLMKFLGFWASLIVLLSLLVISFLVSFNIALIPKKEEVVDEKRTQEALQKGMVLAEDLKSQSLWQKLKAKAKEEVQRSKSSSKKSEDILGQIRRSTEKEAADVALVTGQAINQTKVDKMALAGQLNKANADFKLPPLDFLEKDRGQPTSGDIKANINIIKRTLENFGIEVEMAEVNVGPTVTQYTLRPAQGVKLSKITALQNDLALALAAHPLRIEAPIPGRSLVGIEIPNRSIVLVRLRSLLESQLFQEAPSSLTFAAGRDVAGNPVFADLAQMPHMLVAGATGTGKTIALNNIIVSLLYRNHPDNLKFILIDPKRVELTAYNAMPYLLSPVIVRPDKAVGALRWAVSEMERRFGVLQEAGNRDIVTYNQKQLELKEDSSAKLLPYIVIVIDELADLMATFGRDVEAAIVRLAQMARAVGIHLVVSTQRPSVEVITGLIKANITARMAFQVASQVDSRTILDMAGAEKLLGNGDMLFLAGNSAKPRRIQGAYISDREVRKVTDYLRANKSPECDEEVVFEQTTLPEKSVGFALADGSEADDELYEQAKEVVIQAKKASASLLQRRLRIGYARAARLLDILEEKGVVGAADGAKPREVFIDEGEMHEN